MGAFLIWVIILIVIVVKAVNKSKQEEAARGPQQRPGQQSGQQYGQLTPNRQSQQYGQPTPNRQAQQPVANRQGQYGTRTQSHQYVNPYQEETSQEAMSQAELKAKLQQRYRPNAKTANTIEESRKAKVEEKRVHAEQADILSRANKNAQSYQEDILHEEQCGENLDNAQMHNEKLHNSVETYTQMHKVDFTEYDQESILGDLNDLLVKGYSGSLDFDRDFVGEAVDMLNSFTIPDELPKEMNLQQHA